MESRDWDACDFIIISGDAYVDHPSFGHALIGRLLESEGYRVGVIPQPEWRSVDDFRRLGRPRIAFMITAGSLDSMVNHYTASGKRRRTDVYSPGGEAGRRPDRASIVYTSRARQAYTGVPVILGGIEASLRRLSHFDIWSNRIRRSILIDSKADLLVYGMAETAILEIAHRLARGEDIGGLTDIRGTVYAASRMPEEAALLPSYEETADNPEAFIRSYLLRYRESAPSSVTVLVEPTSDRFVVCNPPSPPLDAAGMDNLYAFPYTRRCHPAYDESGGVPALEEVLFSITHVRGCFGGCAFCALSWHQGKTLSIRSEESVLQEAQTLVADPRFKGYIHDIGGPTANFRINGCSKLESGDWCRHRHCLYPSPCPNLRVDHAAYLSLLRKVRSIPGVKKVFIRSGIRFDYLMADPNWRMVLEEICAYHVSGQLKVAPEHCSSPVLEAMRKPAGAMYRRFREEFIRASRKVGLEQYVLPYYMSSHPGSTLDDAVNLAVELKKSGFVPEQVQEFYPTPSTLSTCMYYTGIDPERGSPVYVPSSGKERSMQRALLQFNRASNRNRVEEALRAAGRTDLIGNTPAALVSDASIAKSARRRQGRHTKNQGRSIRSRKKRDPGSG